MCFAALANGHNTTDCFIRWPVTVVLTDPRTVRDRRSQLYLTIHVCVQFVFTRKIFLNGIYEGLRKGEA